ASERERLEWDALRRHGPLPRNHQIIRRGEDRGRIRVEQAPGLLRVQRTQINTLTLGGTESKEHKVVAVRQELGITVPTVRRLKFRCENRFPTTRMNAVERLNGGVREQNRAVRPPGSATTGRNVCQISHKS